MNEILRASAVVFFACLFVFSCVKFYQQPQPPSLPFFENLYGKLHGGKSQFDIPELGSARGPTFPGAGDFFYGRSERMQLGQHGSTVLGQITSVTFSSATTRLVLSFYSPNDKRIPSVSFLAPNPTLHAGESIFPVRSVKCHRVNEQTMDCGFEFASVTGITDYMLRFYPDEAKRFYLFADNPTPPDQPSSYPKPKGPDVWGWLAVSSLVGLLVLWISNDNEEYVNRLLREWETVDSKREEAAADIRGIDKATVKLERHRAAQASIDRAERIVMEFYEDRLKTTSRSGWVFIGLVLICLVGGTLALFYSSPAVVEERSVRNTNNPSMEYLSKRVVLLEKSRILTIAYMIGGIGITGMAIGANLFFSMRRIKSIARKTIRHRLDKFDSSFYEELISKMEAAEKSISSEAGTFAEIEAKLNRFQAEINEQRQTSRDNIDNVVADQLKRLGMFIENLGTQKDGSRKAKPD